MEVVVFLCFFVVLGVVRVVVWRVFNPQAMSLLQQQQQLPYSGQVFPEKKQRLSILQGPIDPPLVDYTLGELLDLQCQHHGTRECLVFPWTGARWTYNELNHQSRLLAQALLAKGIAPGDRVGIMAGNCEQYAAVFFAVARLGAILVILNNTYTATEAQYALKFTGEVLSFATHYGDSYGDADRGLQTAKCSLPPSPSEGSTTGHFCPLLGRWPRRRQSLYSAVMTRATRHMRI
jgi:hypothetical protein